MAAWQSDFARNVERPRDNSHIVRFYYPYEDSHRLTTSYELAQTGGLSKLLFTGFFGYSRQRTDQDQFPTASSGRTVDRAEVAAHDFGFRATAERLAGPAKVEFGVDVNGRVGLEALDIRVAYDQQGVEILNQPTVSIADATRIDTGLFL